MIYLDNSATTYPKPLAVRQAVVSALTEYGANPGRGSYKMAMGTAEMIYRTRSKLAKLFNGNGGENVVFCQSCTAAINQVMFGYLKAGDHFIISDLEHNAVLRPAERLKSIGMEYSVAETFPEDNDRTINSFKSKWKENTKLIVCTAASNVWGIRLPIERLTALAHIYGGKICVDGAQAAGVIPIDMGDSGIDFLCMPAHKGLYGISGLGVLILGKEGYLEPLIYGGTGVNSISMEQPEDSPERYESGTVNIPAIAGLGAGVDFVTQMGVERIRKEELSITRYLYRELKACKGIKLYTNEPVDPYYIPVISFTGEMPSEEICSKMGDMDIALRGGLRCAPLAHKKMGTSNGAVRVSPSCFTRERDIEAFMRALYKVI